VIAVTRTLGHCAVWLGLYFVAATVLYAHAAGLPVALGERWMLAWGCAGSAGIGVYLLDRAKLRSRWREPADARAHPARSRFVDAHAPTLRLASLALGLISLASAMALDPRLGWLVLAAFAMVLVYAGVPISERAGRTTRVKDLPVVKNLIIAVSVSGFAGLLAHAASEFTPTPRESLPALALTGLVVLLDTVLCDVDDAEPDRAAGTRTLPNLVGLGWTWVIVAVGYAAAWLVPLAPSPAHELPRAVWLAGLPITTLGLGLVARPGRLRDPVDLRLPALAVVAMLS